MHSRPPEGAPPPNLRQAGRAGLQLWALTFEEAGSIEGVSSLVSMKGPVRC